VVKLAGFGFLSGLVQGHVRLGEDHLQFGEWLGAEMRCVGLETRGVERSVSLARGWWVGEVATLRDKAQLIYCLLVST
jgi:hypothetical protein